MALIKPIIISEKYDLFRTSPQLIHQNTAVIPWRIFLLGLWRLACSSPVWRIATATQDRATLVSASTPHVHGLAHRLAVHVHGRESAPFHSSEASPSQATTLHHHISQPDGADHSPTSLFLFAASTTGPSLFLYISLTWLLLRLWIQSLLRAWHWGLRVSDYRSTRVAFKACLKSQSQAQAQAQVHCTAFQLSS